VLGRHGWTRLGSKNGRQAGDAWQTDRGDDILGAHGLWPYYRSRFTLLTEQGATWHCNGLDGWISVR